ncbi:glycosyltransferase family 2 protein [Fannyhessea vaginae]|uniref:glycosyltransferase family 2 protein n=1 Tax=Fannyhessea vaginae TaxID=82135 RepID=UPI003B219BEE
MQNCTLAHVIFENSQRFYQFPTLYCFSTASLQPVDMYQAKLLGDATYDFTSFMNACSVQKWATYTYAQQFFLHVEFLGAPAKIQLTYAKAYDDHAQTYQTSYEIGGTTDEWQTQDIAYELDKDVVVCGFKITTTSDAMIRNCYYYTSVAPEHVCTPELALCTTTFKKESFIIKNAHMVRDYILASSEPIAKHFSMHIVDNGRTLKASDVESAGIVLHPNPNAGGSGGYARGMIEAMRQEMPATHVLLMDDDVSVCPESIMRTYAVLSLVRDTYRDAFISGAMMCLDAMDTRWEDVGHMTEVGQCLSLKSPVSMAYFQNIVRNDLLCSHEEIKQIADNKHCYAGWWYCVIPASTIKRFGLPLPLFVRFDDIEYSLRARPKFISMNGIAVWHMGFNAKYNAAVERYQTTRNSFITQCTTHIASRHSLVARFRDLAFGLDLRKFNYADARLALEGFEDFLKGPRYIMKPGTVEERFMYAHKAAEHLLPAEEFKAQLKDKLDFTLSNVYASSYVSSFENEYDISRSFKQKLIDLITFNGHRFTWLAHSNPEPAIIDVAGWTYPSGVISQREKLLVINRFDGSGTIRTRDVHAFRELYHRFKRDMKFYNDHKTQLERAYQEAMPEMTSVEFWKNYLGIK